MYIMRYSVFTGAALLLPTASLTAAAPMSKSKLSSDNLLNIRDTIAQCAFDIDSKNFASLSKVFTSDVKATA